jgi:hypothetical protein
MRRTRCRAEDGNLECGVGVLEVLSLVLASRKAYEGQCYKMLRDLQGHLISKLCLIVTCKKLRRCPQFISVLRPLFIA